MITYLANSAEQAKESSNLFEALGINPQLLIVQLVSFLVLFALLKKLVYPALSKALDDRQKVIEQSAKAAKHAQESAEKAEAATSESLKKAKQEAAEIVAVAQKEAAAMVEEAEAKANKRAEHIVESAEKRLAQDVDEARAQLRKEVVNLVAAATEIVVGQKIDPKADTDLIQKAIKQAGDR